jgi:AcrR family transcriptional regulator
MAKEGNTKRAILQKGFEMASHLSLEAVTIGSLAEEMKMSKSGVFAHFKSKENLQLEILTYAANKFYNEVIKPSLTVENGIPRIRAIVNRWIDWGLKLKGGCIFVDATTEFNDRPGKIQDLLFKQQKQWVNILKRIAESAKKTGDLRPDCDCEQFAFELYCLVLGHYYYVQLIQDSKTGNRVNKFFDQLLQTYKN